MIHAFFDLKPRDSGIDQAELNVFPNRHMRIKRIVLEHHCQSSVSRIQICNIDVSHHDFSVGNLLQTGNHAQQRGLPAARRPHQHRKTAVRNGQRHIINRTLGRNCFFFFEEDLAVFFLILGDTIDFNDVLQVNICHSFITPNLDKLPIELLFALGSDASPGR